MMFNLTDGQDAQKISQSNMPYDQEHLMHQGTHYQKHYCAMSSGNRSCRVLFVEPACHGLC